MSTKTLLSAPAAGNNGQRQSEVSPPATAARDIPLADIEAAIRGVRHGVVQIIIQDGVVVQIDRTEKMRLR